MRGQRQEVPGRMHINSWQVHAVVLAEKTPGKDDLCSWCTVMELNDSAEPAVELNAM